MEHISKPVTKVWISVRVGRTENMTMDVITLACMVRTSGIYASYLTRIRYRMNSSEEIFSS